MELDLAEALRYLGVKGEPGPELYEEMSAIGDRLVRSVEPRYLYRASRVALGEEGVALEGLGLTLPGTLARRMLEGCGQAMLLVCTLGAGFEAMLRAEQARSMARAAMLDACGSVWVEAGCAAAEEEIAAHAPGSYLTDRFSPGYGDLPLDLQGDICAVLDASRRLGLTVTESLLLNPVKSVTAVIGVSDRPQMARVRGCDYCQMRERCPLRKGGKHCGN